MSFDLAIIYRYKKNRVIFLLSAIAFYLALNLIGINWGLPSVKRNALYFDNNYSVVIEPFMSSYIYRTRPIHTLYPDEYIVLHSLKGMNPANLNFHPGSFFYPSFYYYSTAIAEGLAMAFGFVPKRHPIQWYYLHPDETARLYLVARLVSLFFGLGGLYLIFKAGEELFSLKSGFIASILFSVCPAITIFSTLAMPDLTALFWTIAALRFSLRPALRKSVEEMNFIIGSFFAGLAASTKYPNAFVLSVPLALAILTIRDKKRLIYQLWMILVSFVIGFLIASPYAIIDYQGFLKDIKGIMNDSTFILSSKNPLIHFFKTAIIGIRSSLFYGLSPAVLIAGIIGFIILAFSGNRYLPLLIYGALHFLITTFSFTNQVHYYLPLTPIFFLSIAATINRIKNWRRLNLILISLLILCSLYYSLCFKLPQLSENALIKASEFIREQFPKGSKIGLYESLYYYSPFCSISRYQLYLCDQNCLQINEEQLDGLVISHIYDGFGQIYPDGEKLGDFLQDLKRGDYKFKQMKEYFNPPSLFSFTINVKSLPMDIALFFPSIYIFKKSH